MFDAKVFVATGKIAPREQILYLNKENIALIISFNQHYLIVDWENTEVKTLVTGRVNAFETKEDAVQRVLLEMTGYCQVEKQIPVEAPSLTRFYNFKKSLNQQTRYDPYLIKLKSLERIPTFVERKDMNLDWLDLEEVKNAGLLENQLYMFERALFVDDLS